MRTKGHTAFLSEYLRHQTEALQQEVGNFPESQLVTCSENAILDRLTQKYTVTPLQIDWANESMAPPAKITPAAPVDPMGNFFMDIDRLCGVQKYVLRFQVPISGDVTLLDFRPSTMNLSLPPFTVNNGELGFEITISTNRRDEAKNTIERYKAWIQQHIETINMEISAYNTKVSVNALRFLKIKNQDRSQLLDFFTDIGIPIKNINDEQPNQTDLIKIANIKPMYSAAISYGGTDESVAQWLNNYLKLHGVTTWFFPDDAKLGQHLHRTMYEMANDYDRVLLLCSKESLNRPGVLNEIERVLAREAKGGHEILIPIRLDDYVLSEWAPDRPDIADQIRGKVIGKLNSSNFDSEETQKQLARILLALTKK